MRPLILMLALGKSSVALEQEKPSKVPQILNMRPSILVLALGKTTVALEQNTFPGTRKTSQGPSILVLALDKNYSRS